MTPIITTTAENPVLKSMLSKVDYTCGFWDFEHHEICIHFRDKHHECVPCHIGTDLLTIIILHEWAHYALGHNGRVNITDKSYMINEKNAWKWVEEFTQSIPDLHKQVIDVAISILNNNRKYTRTLTKEALHELEEMEKMAQLKKEQCYDKSNSMQL